MLRPCVRILDARWILLKVCKEGEAALFEGRSKILNVQP